MALAGLICLEGKEVWWGFPRDDITPPNPLFEQLTTATSEQKPQRWSATRGLSFVCLISNLEVSSFGKNFKPHCI